MSTKKNREKLFITKNYLRINLAITKMALHSIMNIGKRLSRGKFESYFKI